LISASPLSSTIDLRLHCRQRLLALAANLSETEYYRQAHPSFSPIGWHLGHIAYTEALWLLERHFQQPSRHLEWRKLFAADGLAKIDRQNLPAWPEVWEYLSWVRQEVDRLSAKIPPPERLMNWLVEHESQHLETIHMVLALHHHTQVPIGNSVAPAATPQVLIPASEFWLGVNHSVIDNEGPQHQRSLSAYRIDQEPVTIAQYREFILQDGYRDRQFWSAAGWQWLQSHPVDRPLYWAAADLQPVCGLSWYEADAYARFVGKRLPTEAEWEKAAPLLDLVGQVWEWTMSTFGPYPNFQPYPYGGYSQAYFDNEHFVLRGASKVTEPAVRRHTFRNWYHPDVRQMFAGCRCVSDI
jgi:gamma-glutamyl hercynylcysteine S-oxide synthase